MKIGIGIFTAPEAGGAYQYTRSIIQAAAEIKKSGGQFDFVCYSLYELWEPICVKMGVPFKRLSENKVQKALYHCGYLLGQIGGVNSKSYNSGFYKFHPLWKAYDEDNLSAMIITSPSWYGKPEGKKLIMPIFDIMHRYLDFPEIGGGKIGQERDIRYASICKGADALLTDSKLGVMQLIECYGNLYDGLIRKAYALPFIVPDYISEMRTGEKDNAKILTKVPEKYILYPAQFWKHKNHVRLITAAGELKEQGINVNLVLTGSGKNAGEEIAATIDKYGMQEQVTNLGYISDEELTELYKHARAMMFPAFTGPTSIPPLEAMALGCPVAVANNFAMPEQLNGAGLDFDPTSVSDIKDAMRRLWLDDRLCEAIIEREKKRSREWTVKEFAEELRKIIVETI